MSYAGSYAVCIVQRCSPDRFNTNDNTRYPSFRLFFPISTIVKNPSTSDAWSRFRDFNRRNKSHPLERLIRDRWNLFKFIFTTYKYLRKAETERIKKNEITVDGFFGNVLIFEPASIKMTRILWSLRSRDPRLVISKTKFVITAFYCEQNVNITCLAIKN